MAANRNEIIEFLDKYLGIEKWPDDYHNGLLVSGAREVKKIIVGVNVSLEIFEKAKDRGAEMVITHHFIFANDESQIPSYEAKRIPLKIWFLRQEKSMVPSLLC
jgi:putative NIF3 family GTP cyclohydrolase 1 type 2